MAAKLIDGKAIAEKVKQDAAKESAEFIKETGITPGLVVVIVGEDPASQVYVRSKHKACTDLGWYSEILTLPENVSQEDLEKEIDSLNADPKVHGILVQLPLPKHLNEESVLLRMDPDKDVDGFHPVNVGKLSLGIPAPVPCTPAGVQRMLIEEGIETSGKFVVVLGRSNIVGKPVAQLLMAKGKGGDATVCICHSRTKDLNHILHHADIVVAAIGVPKFVKAEWIKPGATVIDVGINRIDDPTTKTGKRLVGDVDFDAVKEVAGAITPVPGGVGPMTIAMLMLNTLECARIYHNKTKA